MTGLVLAAGGSKRLGRPKQLLPFGSATLLDHVLDTARACRFDQLLCVVGGGADDVRARVDLRGIEVVENQHFGEGCSSSIAAALGAVDERAEALVLMLGDQPGVTAEAVTELIAGAAGPRWRRVRTPTAVAIRWLSRAICSETWHRCTETRACGSSLIATPKR